MKKPKNLRGGNTRYKKRRRADSYHQALGRLRRILGKYVLCKKDYTPAQAEVIIYRLSILDKVTEAKRRGVLKKDMLAILEIAPRTYHRWRKAYDDDGVAGLLNTSRARRKPPPRTALTAELLEAVLAERELSPINKTTLASELYKKYGILASASTVGRAIAMLKAAGRIQPCLRGKWRRSAVRGFRRVWAGRRRRKPVVTEPGHWQIDHMTVSDGRATIKVFVARDVYSNLTYCMAACNATAATARRFLVNHLLQSRNAIILSIQTDGGSEFKGEFEAECQASNIPLFIIPPNSPRCNGKVENANGVIRSQVFNFRNDFGFTVPEVQEVLDEFEEDFNNRSNLALPANLPGKPKFVCYSPLEYNHLFYQTRGGKHPLKSAICR